MTEDIDGGVPDPGEAAETAARNVYDSVREINHNSKNLYPAEVWRIIGALSEAAAALPQTFDQLEGCLEDLAESCRIRSDTNTLQSDMATALVSLEDAGELAQQLRDRLAAAHAATTGMGYISADE